MGGFRKNIYFLVRKYIFSPFINFKKERIDSLTREITKYRKDKLIEDDYIFNLIEEEYEKIFDENLSEDEIMCLKEYMRNIPFIITLRELKGNKVIKVFELDNMNALSKEFKEMTEIDDIYASINEILEKLDEYVVSVEFNYNSKYINIHIQIKSNKSFIIVINKIINSTVLIQ